MPKNQLYYGDNLDILRRYVDDESVDLVYLDPPFKSNQDYNVLFAERDGSQAAAQIMAFEDTWSWDQAAAAAYQEAAEAAGNVSKALQAFRSFLGEIDMMAYLAMMAPRLVELRRVLKATGSIYLHCDPTSGHYLKMLMMPCSALTTSEQKSSRNGAVLTATPSRDAGNTAESTTLSCITRGLTTGRGMFSTPRTTRATSISSTDTWNQVRDGDTGLVI